MPGNAGSYSPEFKEQAAKMVVETSQPIAHVARELNVNETTLGNWVKEYREDARGRRCPRCRYRSVRGCASSSGENRELKMKVEFLSKAAAYFAREHR